MSIPDHYPIFISIFQNTNTKQNTNNLIKLRNINDDSIAKFKSELEILFDITIRYLDDSASAFTLFYTKLNALYEKYFPVITKPARKKELINPWVTPYLAKRINIRHKLGRLASKGRIDKDIFKRFRNKLTMELRGAKSYFYSNKFSNCKGDMKKNLGNHK